MHTADFLNLADELELDEHELRAVEVILEAMTLAVRRRLPVTLELHGVGIDVGRPCMCEHCITDSRGGVAASTEELH